MNNVYNILFIKDLYFINFRIPLHVLYLPLYTFSTQKIQKFRVKFLTSFVYSLLSQVRFSNKECCNWYRIVLLWVVIFFPSWFLNPSLFFPVLSPLCHCIFHPIQNCFHPRYVRLISYLVFALLWQFDLYRLLPCLSTSIYNVPFIISLHFLLSTFSPSSFIPFFILLHILLYILLRPPSSFFLYPLSCFILYYL